MRRPLRRVLAALGSLMGGVGSVGLLRAQSDLPLAATRQVSFTTREGTWMSVDVSPDGRTIAFDLLGDLYTLPIGGGKATRITSGPAVDLQPRFSPDGRRIVFVSDRSGCFNLWMANADGGDPRPVTRQIYLHQGDRRFVTPVWTPDGRAIVAAQSDSVYGFDLVAYDTAGRRLTEIALASKDPPPDARGRPMGGTFYTASPTFGRDPGFLYATQYEGAPSATGHPQSNEYQVARIEWATGARRLVTAELGSGIQPLASPDGRYLAYATQFPSKAGLGTAIKLLDLGTGAASWLTRRVEPSLQGSFVDWPRGLLPSAAFTPDSRAIVLSSGGKLWRIAVPSGREEEIPFVAEVDQALGPLLRFPLHYNDSLLTSRIVRDVRPSPDGKWLAFVALDEIWTMALPSGAPRRLTTSTGVTEHAPAWSPDSRYLAYATWSERGGDIYRVPVGELARDGANGGTPGERLTATSDYYDKLVYSPEGSILAFVRSAWRRAHSVFAGHRGPLQGPDELQLASLPAGGGAITPLTGLGKDPYGFGWPHFSRRDSTRVFVYTEHALWSVRRDGSDRRAVVRTTGGTWPPENADILLSPAGDRALFAAASTVWLVPVPADRDSVVVPFDDPYNGPPKLQALTPEGGDFPWWSADGAAFTYSLGPRYITHRFAPPTGGGDRVASENILVLVPKDRPRGALLLQGARVITMRGREVLEHADVLIENNRIAAVGPSGSLRVPSRATRIDVTGKTLLPGYIPTHEHLHEAPFNVHAPRYWEYLLALAYGVTTVLDPQSNSSADQLTYADRVETGELLGPRHVATGSAIMSQRLDSWESTRDVVRRYSRYYDTHMLKERDAGQRLLRQWVAIAAGEERLTPVGHWDHDMVSMILDGYSGIEHAEFVPWYDDMVQLVARSGTVYTPTTLIASNGPAPVGYFSQQTDLYRERKLWRFAPREFLNHYLLRPDVGWYPLGLKADYAFPREAAQAAKLIKAGGKVGMATDGLLPGLGNHWEIWAHVLGGMAPYDALRSATLTGAEAIGMDRDLGSIEPGKLADLQILDQNPLANIRNSNTVRYVMKGGRLYEAKTLDEIWPRHRALLSGSDDRPWWWDDLPPGAVNGRGVAGPAPASRRPGSSDLE